MIRLAWRVVIFLLGVGAVLQAETALFEYTVLAKKPGSETITLDRNATLCARDQIKIRYAMMHSGTFYIVLLASDGHYYLLENSSMTGEGGSGSNLTKRKAWSVFS